MITSYTSPTLYKRDNKNKVRIWSFQTGYDGDTAAFRTVSGLQDGKSVVSAWKVVQPKNTGRANATTADEQALSEGNSAFAKRLDSGYYTDIKDIDSFAKVKAMLAVKIEDMTIDFNKNTYYSQPKLDGIRCLARADGLWSRSYKPIVGCPHIMDQLKPFFDKNPTAVLDGELYNHELRDNFDKIVSLVRKSKPTADDLVESANNVEYHVYDTPTLGDADFSDRTDWLTAQDFGGSIKTVDTLRVDSQDAIDNLYGAYLSDGFEGQMVRVDAPYEGKRSKTLMKRKEFLDREFPVISIEEGKGNWANHAKRFFFQLDDGRSCGAGVRGNQSTLQSLLTKSTPDWCTVRYFTPTPDGMPRFPVVVAWGWGERDY